MSETDNTRIVQECYEMFGKGDVPGLLAALDDNIGWTVPEIENSRFGGKRTGTESVGRFFQELVEDEDMTHFEPKEFIAQGDKVVVLGSSTATVRATGNSYSTDWVHVFTLAGGKVTAFTEFFDNAAATRAFQKSAAA
jgi:ketosteroid isomerase-like protein